MRSHGSIDSPAGFGPSDHLCWSYEDREELRRVAVAWLEDGHRLGQQLLYVAGRGTAELRDDLAELPGVDRLIASGVLTLAPLQDVFDAAVNDPRARIGVALGAALDAGFTGLRVFSDPTALLDGPHGHDALAGWEAAADHFMALGNQLCVLCAYDRRVLQSHPADDITCLHPLVHATVPFRVFGDGDAVVIGGEVDAFGAQSFRRALTHCRRAGDAVLDLSRIHYIDHRGLRAIAAHAGDLRRDGGTLTVRGAPPVVHRVWELAGLGGEDLRWAA